MHNNILKLYVPYLPTFIVIYFSTFTTSHIRFVAQRRIQDALQVFRL